MLIYNLDPSDSLRSTAGEEVGFSGTVAIINVAVFEVCCPSKLKTVIMKRYIDPVSAEVNYTLYDVKNGFPLK